MKKTWLLLPIAASQCVMPLVSCTPTNDSFPYETLMKSYQKMLIETIDTSAYKDKTINEIKSELDEVPETKFQKDFKAYKFYNIDYSDGDKALWPAHQHIVRTLQIAILAYQRNDRDLMDIANRLTGFWLCNDFHNENWWFNQIGVPRDFSNLAIFVINNLPNDQQECMMEWLRHGSLKYNPETLDETGTNMFWAGDITLKCGLLAKDYSEIELMFEKVGEEIKFDKDEGFKSDGSYFQHGHQLYTGGYGRQGALLLAKIASAFIDSDIQLDENKLKIIISFVVDGLKYFTHKSNFNWQCMGRTFVRKQATQFNGGTTDLGNIDELRYFAQLPNCPRKDELQELLDHWQKGEPSFKGVKFFKKSKFAASCIDGIYIGFKGTAGDLINCEIANDENILSHNMVFGVNTCVMEDGNEYADISPLWDYSHIPGTTSYPEDDVTLQKYDNEAFKHTKTGVFYATEYVDDDNKKDDEDQTYVCITQASWHEHLWPSITWYEISGFMTPYGLAVLGCDVHDNQHDGELVTTVEQCYKAPDKTLTVSNDEKTIINGQVAYSNIESEDTSKLSYDVDTRGGKLWSWHRNNHSYPQSDWPDDAKILTVKINNIDNSKYAYAIQPVSQYNLGQFKVASNDDEAQAVEMPDGRIAARFFKDEAEFTYQGHTYTGSKGEFIIFDNQ